MSICFGIGPGAVGSLRDKRAYEGAASDVRKPGSVEELRCASEHTAAEQVRVVNELGLVLDVAEVRSVVGVHEESSRHVVRRCCRGFAPAGVPEKLEAVEKRVRSEAGRDRVG